MKLIVALVAAMLLMVAYVVWFWSTHTCVKRHRDTCVSTNYMFDGKGNITGSYPTFYDCEVCDQWEKDQ